MNITEVVAALIWDGDKFMICQRPAHKARGFDCICFIRALLRLHDIDIDEEFVYSARSYKDATKE